MEDIIISQRLIDVRKKELKISKTDKILVFLMYDMDVPVVNERIKDCRAYKLLSNPAIEFWFLLHGKDWRTKISTAEAYSELLKNLDNPSSGIFNLILALKKSLR